MRNDDEAIFLRRRLVAEPDDHERARLLKTLVDQWPDDPETENTASYAVIRDAVTDPEPSVRAAAVTTMGRYRAVDRPATARTLYERATTDEDPDVRDAAMSAMVTRSDEPRLWPDSPEAVASLRDYVAADPFAYSRRAVVNFMLGDFVDDLGIRALLSRLAEHHPSWASRNDVIRTLARNGHGHADTKATLLRLAATDPQSEVRRQLLIELVRAYRDDATTTEFLAARAEQDPDPEVRADAEDLLDDPELILALGD